MSVERHPYPPGPQHAALLRVLLALDGSTTRACEAAAQSEVELQVVHQAPTTEVPHAVREQLGGKAWLMRVTSLHAHARVLMDNLAYIRLDAVPDDFLRELHQGQAPIGHLLKQLFVRRESVPGSPELSNTLWDHVGAPDPQASRSYRIVTPEGPLMLIFEAYRAGMVGAGTAP